jgi:hypothetical protein
MILFMPISADIVSTMARSPQISRCGYKLTVAMPESVSLERRILSGANRALTPPRSDPVRL